MQAREWWSRSETVHYRPGHFWLAEASDVREVRKIETRCTIDGVMFSPGDYLVRIGRHFDRGVCLQLSAHAQCVSHLAHLTFSIAQRTCFLSLM